MLHKFIGHSQPSMSPKHFYSLTNIFISHVITVVYLKSIRNSANPADFLLQNLCKILQHFRYDYKLNTILKV